MTKNILIFRRSLCGIIKAAEVRLIRADYSVLSEQHRLKLNCDNNYVRNMFTHIILNLQLCSYELHQNQQNTRTFFLGIV